MKNTKNIDALNFLDFVQATEAAREEGYVFDFSTNATAPQNLGFRYFAVMVKGTKNVYAEQTKKEAKPVEPEKEEVQETTPDVEDKKEPQQRGRKPNSAK